MEDCSESSLAQRCSPCRSCSSRSWFGRLALHFWLALAHQSSGDERHVHGLRRYSAGHYLTEFSDAAIDATLARGVPSGGPEPDWALMPGGGYQAYGGAIADVGDEESAFSHRNTLVEFFAGSTWADPAEDEVRMAGARRWAATLEPFSSGTYVNVMADADSDVSRGYHAEQLARLADLKRKYDPDNIFHLNRSSSIRCTRRVNRPSSRPSFAGMVVACTPATRGGRASSPQ